MATYNYEKFKILISPDSKKTQGLKTGDVVRRQYFDNPNLIYSLMVVLETGTDVIGGKDSSYFIGALLDGDEPKTGELLDFVRMTSLSDTERSGALYLTASDSGAPFMDVVDGMGMENSLCYPYMHTGKGDIADKDKYACFGDKYVSADYQQSEGDARRIFTLTRNRTLNSNESFGFKQSIERKLEHPMRVLVSFRVKASKALENVCLNFGYTNGEETDGTNIISVSTQWEYKLFAVTTDYPSQYQRSFWIDLTNHLTEENDSCGIADLNIILLSDVATFSNGTKARVGKMTGVIDPVFGVLDGYGAYFQNMYATKNVNIAGTLTAGDENGFSSTFYVGKIHKNVILDSANCRFDDYLTQIVPAEQSVTGVGKVWQTGLNARMICQSSQWRKSHAGQKYCFSFWIKSDKQTIITIYQDEGYAGTLSVDTKGEWRRFHVSFVIKDFAAGDLIMKLICSQEGALLTAPQLEAGITPSQYQPTDGTLSYVEDYGAWFSKGGIGGTIQNPLLKLNEDGSISSKNNSFVINPDGTGHFASGRFRWTNDTIILQDVTIRWEDMDEEARENLQSKSVTLRGTNVFHFSDELDEGTCEPLQITVFASEQNFISTDKKWEYQASDGLWHPIAGNRKDFIHISPSSHYWEGRNVLSIKYIATFNEKEYSDVFTINKQYDGSSAYSVYIDSSKGYVFRNGIISTLLQASVYKGGEDVTAPIPENNFTWTRISEDKEADAIWNSAGHTGKSLEITDKDILYKAVFDCRVVISTT